MIGNILGEPFDDFVNKQIETRQKAQYKGFDGTSRDLKDINYLSNRNAWVKMVSSVSIEDEQLLSDIGLSNPSQFKGLNLAQKCVLFNGLNNVNSPNTRQGITTTTNIWNESNLYGLGGSEYGISPPPGIIKLDVKSINRGSIRRAEVQIKAYNRYQFDILELLYVRLGFGMLIEWGWNKFINNEGDYENMGNTLVEEKWFSSSLNSFEDIIKEIAITREVYSGNYDGFYGKVTNFDWDFDEDGSYNITLSLITVGDVIESLKVNNLTPDINEKFVEEDSNTPNVSNNLPLIDIEGNDLLSRYLSKTIKQNIFKKSLNYFLLKDIKSSAKRVTTNSVSKYGYYMTLGELLLQIESQVIPYIKNSNKETPLLKFEKNEQLNLCSSYFNLISTDPRKCLIRPEFYFPQIINKKNYVDYGYMRNIVKELKQFSVYKPIEKDKGFIYGKLMNIYINYDFILQNLETEQSITIFEFIQNICEGINSCFGGIINLEPIIKNDYIITIIDQNFTPFKFVKELGISEQFTNKPPESTKINVFGYNREDKTSNFLKNFKFKTKITPQISSLISIGATADRISTKNYQATAFSKWNLGLKDRFNHNIKETSKTSKTSKIPATEKDGRYSKVKLLNLYEQGEKKTSYPLGTAPIKYTTIKINQGGFVKTYTVYNKEEFIQQYNDDYDLYIRKDNSNLSEKEEYEFEKSFEGYIYYNIIEHSDYFKFEPKVIEEGKKLLSLSYTNYVNRYFKETKGEQITNNIGFIPLSFNLKLDGIAGFKIYQQLNLDQTFLPKKYPKIFNFLITGLSHTIENNNWLTNLDTISTSNIVNPISKISFNNIKIDEGVFRSNSNIPFKLIDNRNKQYLEVNNIELFVKNNFNSNPEVQEPFLKFFNTFTTGSEYNGYSIIITSLDRSIEKSKQLKLENPNNANPGESLHNYHAAIDINVLTPEGNYLNKSTSKSIWERYPILKVADTSELSWGGNFTNYYDPVHFYPGKLNGKRTLRNYLKKANVKSVYDLNLENVNFKRIKVI